MTVFTAVKGNVENQSADGKNLVSKKITILHYMQEKTIFQNLFLTINITLDFLLRL